MKELLREEAILIHKEDEEINRNKQPQNTAPLQLLCIWLKEKGWNLKIFSDEIRPRLQGSTLTALELQWAGIDVTVITDNMAAMVMSQGKKM
jgi:methylthioribose-1-phosphate isomerase